MTTPLLVLAGRQARAALAWLFPSVPHADQARVLAAMEGRTYQPPTTPLAKVTPSPEVLLNWRAHPHHRWEFTDTRMADLVDRWTREARS